MTHRPSFSPAMNRAGLSIAPDTATHPTVKRKPKQKQKPEAALQSKIIKALEKRGALVIRTNAGMARNASGDVIQIGKAGTSDLQVCYQGRWISLEVKAPGGRLTPKQARFLEQVQAAGGIAAVVSSVDQALAVLEDAR